MITLDGVTGPFNDLEEVRKVFKDKNATELQILSGEHDLRFQEIADSGKNPYLTTGQSDWDYIQSAASLIPKEGWKPALGAAGIAVKSLANLAYGGYNPDDKGMAPAGERPDPRHSGATTSRTADLAATQGAQRAQARGK